MPLNDEQRKRFQDHLNRAIDPLIAALCIYNGDADMTNSAESVEIRAIIRQIQDLIKNPEKRQVYSTE